MASLKVPLLFPWALVVYLDAIIRGGMASHETVGFYLFSLLFWIIAVTGCVIALVLGAQLGRFRTVPRPRWLYGLAAAFWLLLFGAGFGLAVHHRPAWSRADGPGQALAGLAVFGIACCALAAFMMLGRAVAWGRVRQLFWLRVPSWLPGT